MEDHRGSSLGLELIDSFSFNLIVNFHHSISFTKTCVRTRSRSIVSDRSRPFLSDRSCNITHVYSLVIDHAP